MTTVTHLVHGFDQADHSRKVCMVLDLPENDYSPHDKASQIVGPGVCFHFSENVSHPVPDHLKGILLTLTELYERVPELNPHKPRARKTKKSARHPFS